MAKSGLMSFSGARHLQLRQAATFAAATCLLGGRGEGVEKWAATDCGQRQQQQQQPYCG